MWIQSHLLGVHGTFTQTQQLRMIGTNIFSGFRSSVMIVLMMMMVTCAGPEWSLIVGPYKAQPNSPPTLSSSILFSNRTAKDSLEEALLIPNSIATTTTTTDCVCSPSRCGQLVQRRSWEIWSSAGGLCALQCARW